MIIETNSTQGVDAYHYGKQTISLNRYWRVYCRYIYVQQAVFSASAHLSPWCAVSRHLEVVCVSLKNLRHCGLVCFVRQPM